MNFFKKTLLKNALKSDKMSEAISGELKKQLQGSGMPESMILKFIEGMKENPDLFYKLAETAEKAQKEGRDPQQAIMELASQNPEEFKKLFS